MTTHPVFRTAAERLGWSWSPTHNGLINEAVRKSNPADQHEGGFIVATDYEDACSLSGIDTVDDALGVVGTSRSFTVDNVPDDVAEAILAARVPDDLDDADHSYLGVTCEQEPGSKG